MAVDPMRVQAVFLAAVEAPDAAARAAVLDRECGADRELRQRVVALLSAHDAPDSFLDRPAVEPEPAPPAPPDDTLSHSGSEDGEHRVASPPGAYDPGVRQGPPGDADGPNDLRF